MTMTDFFEVDEKQKTVKILNLDDFSVEDLQNYISELQTEILRVQDEIKKKENLKLNACLLYTSPSPRDNLPSRMPSSA